MEEYFPWPIKNSALRSLLAILVEKGHVTRRLKGKAYYYKAKTPRQTLLKRGAKHMANVFCGGPTAALITQLMKIERLSEDDIRELQKIANQKIDATQNERKSCHD